MQASANLKLVVDRAGELPAVPEIVAQVLRLTDDPRVDMSRMGDVIQRDPALTAKILKISNSAYYGLKQHVGTLKLALVVLGIWEVRNIVLGVSVFDALRTGDADSVLGGDSFYKHAFVVGALSKKLCKRLALDSHGEAFVSGVLHDIGKLMLVRQLGAPYARAYLKAAGDSAFLCEAETALLGFTHADAAAALSAHWDFPQTLSDALWLHHASESASLADAKDPELAAVVRLANLAAHIDWDSPQTPDVLAAAGDDVWDCLDAARSPIPRDSRNDIIKEFVDELAESPAPAF
ncbi:MAG: HDOD domain-containing protein [Candidatus Hydrogenedentes bacterium]|nr:HDOD domain-containing protein [Candidatus Hydrogenedentota bacterium]